MQETTSFLRTICFTAVQAVRTCHLLPGESQIIESIATSQTSWCSARYPALPFKLIVFFSNWHLIGMQAPSGETTEEVPGLLAALATAEASHGSIIRPTHISCLPAF